jgi:hypothetical protein
MRRKPMGKVLNWPTINVPEVRCESFRASEAFSVFSGIARAHAATLVPNFEERERLSKVRDDHHRMANMKRAAARKLLEEAFECDETAKRMEEQMGMLKP